MFSVWPKGQPSIIRLNLIYDEAACWVRLAVISCCLMNHSDWWWRRADNSKALFHSAFVMPGGEVQPSQPAVLCSLCWYCVWSVYHPPPPHTHTYTPPAVLTTLSSSLSSSLCHTQLFYSSVSRCPPLFCFISMLLLSLSPRLSSL